MTVSPESRREYHRRWYQKHKGTERQRSAQAGRDFYWKIRNAVFDKLGGKCSRCGFEDRRALQIDHINGGGKKEIKRGWQWVKKALDENNQDYQILCANCNWIKRHERGEGNLRKYKDLHG